MTMRIRQIKPAFFKDARIAELAPPVRLFYIGLWMLADDAGWFAWDPAEVGIELYGYEPRTRRERNVVAYLDALVKEGRVIRHECGHLSIPTFTEHQRLAGLTKQVRTVAKEHEKRCVPQPPADTRGSLQSPDTVRNGTVEERNGVNGTVRSGSERVGAQARDEEPREDDSESDFRRRVGLPVFMGGQA